MCLNILRSHFLVLQVQYLSPYYEKTVLRDEYAIYEFGEVTVHI